MLVVLVAGPCRKIRENVEEMGFKPAQAYTQSQNKTDKGCALIN